MLHFWDFVGIRICFKGGIFSLWFPWNEIGETRHELRIPFKTSDYRKLMQAYIDTRKGRSRKKRKVTFFDIIHIDGQDTLCTIPGTSCP